MKKEENRKWPKTWIPFEVYYSDLKSKSEIEQSAKSIEKELNRELPKGHVLYNEEVHRICTRRYLY